MHRTIAVGMALATVFTAGGCGSGGSDGQGTATTVRDTSVAGETTTTAAAPVDPTFVQLCTVLDVARGGDVDTAKLTFDHGPIHTLADATIPVDRGVAARLLEAKEAVESDFAAASLDPTAITADLGTLVDATGAALVATGTAEAPACEPETP